MHGHTMLDGVLVSFTKNISSYTEIFAVTKYPTYILIDEKGEIIDFDAPLPSDENIETVLSELLK